MWPILAFIGAKGYWFLLIGAAIIFYNFHPRLAGPALGFLLLNNIINVALKLLIKQPRPSGFTQSHRGIDEADYRGQLWLLYGMPSGHVQNAVFIYLLTLWISKGEWAWFTTLGAFIIGLTAFQRVEYRKHTPEQVAVGAVVGWFVAYYSYGFLTAAATYPDLLLRRPLLSAYPSIGEER